MTFWIILCCLPIAALAMGKCESDYRFDTTCSDLELSYDQPIVVTDLKEHLTLVNCTGDIGIITLSLLQNVTRLRIRGGKITNIQDGALCSLGNLQRFVLNYSEDFPTLTRKQLRGCRQLDSLAIDVPFEEDAFEDLSNLKDLILYNQTIEHLTKQHFKPLKNLRYLQMFNSSFNEIDGNSICVPPNLERIQLKINKFPNLTESTFRGCKKLKHLTLMNLDDESVYMDESTFNDLSSLTFLEIYNFQLDGTLTKTFTEAFENLKSLGLKKCSIYEIEDDAFIHAPKLNSLYLGHTNLSRIDLSLFQNLTKFEELHLLFDNLKEIEIRLLPNLRSFSFENNSIADLSMEMIIQNFPKLEYIGIQGNPLNARFIEDFGKQNRISQLYSYAPLRPDCCSVEYWLLTDLLMSVENRLAYNWLIGLAT